ncbi:MAG: DEAD/DEAH box helicase [Elusimicrobiaceae bacterium]|nr:DEAD/DEAH box helicase [Elusimicrobiaceae bacterium]
MKPPWLRDMEQTVFSLLPEFLQCALAQQGIVSPTPVQVAAIPQALAGRDVLATAQTGTGKTLAFLLPLAVRLAKQAGENALILSPTRELAQQTFEQWQILTGGEDIPAVLIIGGDNIHKQFADLRRKPRVIVATPGRVIDHLQRKSMDLRHTHTLVLDETDRMLDMGFIDDMRHIVHSLAAPRRTLLFSATLPAQVKELAREFLTDPVRVQIGSVVKPAEFVFQEIVRVDIREKLPQLLHELNTRSGSVLIFTRTKHGAERLAKQLKLYGRKCNALHGDLRQNRRRQVLEFFKNQTVRVLIATDVAARGIDVPHIAHVINYDLPQSPQDYIHRIGRTGRMGAVGNSISFIAGDEEKWKDICKVTQFVTPVKTVQKTIEPLPAPKFVAQEEGAVHGKNRKRKISRQAVSSKATARAKELLASGEVYLPQGKELERARQAQKNFAHKKIKTFQKAVQAAQILEEKSAHSFRCVKVGASRKTLRAQQPLTKQKGKKQCFSKRKKRR